MIITDYCRHNNITIFGIIHVGTQKKSHIWRYRHDSKYLMISKIFLYKNSVIWWFQVPTVSIFLHACATCSDSSSDINTMTIQLMI